MHILDPEPLTLGRGASPRLSVGPVCCGQAAARASGCMELGAKVKIRNKEAPDSTHGSYYGRVKLQVVIQGIPIAHEPSKWIRTIRPCVD